MRGGKDIFKTFVQEERAGQRRQLRQKENNNMKHVAFIRSSVSKAELGKRASKMVKNGQKDN